MKVFTKKQILIPFFIFFFILCYSTLKAIAETVDKVVAVVNGEIITLTELNEAVSLILKSTGTTINFNSIDKGPAEIKREILDRLIDNKLLEQEAKKTGIIVSEKDLDKALENIQNENSISREGLLKSLEARGMSLEQYKEQLKLEIEKARLINREVKAKVLVKEDELKKYYTDNKDSFKEITETRVQHIFLPIPPNADETKSKDVYEKAREILVKINNNEDFGKLAEMYSKDPSAASGGDMGWFKSGEITPFLENVVFSLKVGEVSNIIVSSLGLHIVKLTDRKEKGLKPFEDVKGDIRDTIYAEKMEDEFKGWLEGLRKKSFIKVKL